MGDDLEILFVDFVSNEISFAIDSFTKRLLLTLYLQQSTKPKTLQFIIFVIKRLSYT